jgi:hypothetical protein
MQILRLPKLEDKVDLSVLARVLQRCRPSHRLLSLKMQLQPFSTIGKMYLSKAGNKLANAKTIGKRASPDWEQGDSGVFRIDL